MGEGSVAAATEVKVPDIGDFKDVPIIEVHVKEGDSVNAEDPLITLESDKASMEVPAPSGGAPHSPRARRRSHQAESDGREGPDHQGGRRTVPQGAERCADSACVCGGWYP